MTTESRHHYEVVVMIHPDHVTEQMHEVLERYKAVITKHAGIVHRAEDWGKKALAYTIQDVRKANYFLLNVECSTAAIDAFAEFLKFNDAVIRKMIMRKKTAETDATVMTALNTEDRHRSRNAYAKFPKNYMNVEWMKQHILETGRIIPSRMTGTSAKTQRVLSHSIKLARILALLPYCDRHK